MGILGGLAKAFSRGDGEEEPEANQADPRDLILEKGFKLTEFVKESDGIRHPDWAEIDRWVLKHMGRSKKDQDEAYRGMAYLWADSMMEDLGGDYELHRSANFVMVSSQGTELANAILESAEQFIDGVKTFLPEAFATTAGCPTVILHFGEPETFLPYKKHFRYPQDPSTAPVSLGFYINSGYGHVALCAADADRATRIVRHELAHAVLEAFPHPRWLNEGLAENLPLICCAGQAHYRKAPAERHLEFWDSENIQKFWGGTLFCEREGAGLGYDLAAVLVSKIYRESKEPREFRNFILDASEEAAGDLAARRYLGRRLGTYVEELLGEGEWDPDPHEIDMQFNFNLYRSLTKPTGGLNEYVLIFLEGTIYRLCQSLRQSDGNFDGVTVGAQEERPYWRFLDPVEIEDPDEFRFLQQGCILILLALAVSKEPGHEDYVRFRDECRAALDRCKSDDPDTARLVEIAARAWKEDEEVSGEDLQWVYENIALTLLGSRTQCTHESSEKK